MRVTSTAVLLAAMVICSTASGADEMPASIDDLWLIIQRQQAEIDSLRDEVRATRQDVNSTNDKVAMTEARVEATGDYVDTLATLQSRPSTTTVGGYGELHYNNVSTDVGSAQEIDFHRFVLFFGHEFSDRIRFFSELELEHSLSGDGKPGEVELEQAYVDFALTDRLSARTGLFLLPVGLINETHEPPSFYGVERNDVENIILPATWWEAGAALSGHLDNGLSWDIAMHSGLAMETAGGNAFRVRSGRQKVAEAAASDPAYTARLRYTGLPGLELAASYQYQSNPSQVDGDGLDSGQLFTTHAAYRHGGFGLRALYAAWNFDGAKVGAAGADHQAGWYLEPSYRLAEKWGVYGRYEDLDGARDQDKFTQNQVGVNFWPTDGVVFKMDYRRREHTLGALTGGDFDAVDLGFGYSF